METEKLQAVVIYKNRYHTLDGKTMASLFSLDEAIKVNVFVENPTVNLLKLVLYVDDTKAASKLLYNDLDLCFQPTASRFPEGVQFFRPTSKNGTGLALLTHCVVFIRLTGEAMTDDNLVIIKTDNITNYYTNSTNTSHL